MNARVLADSDVKYWKSKFLMRLNIQNFLLKYSEFVPINIIFDSLNTFFSSLNIVFWKYLRKMGAKIFPVFSKNI